MKDKRRSLKTKFWEDSFIENLSPSHKLLYIYLLTNPMTNLIGIYEITKRRIKFDTGLDDKTISNGFERFAKAKKAFFLDEKYMIISNWLKNQDFNTNMLKGAKAELKNLPKYLTNKVLGKGSEGLLNDSKWLPNGSLSFENIEVEIEVEIEEEVKGENKKNIPSLDEFISYSKTIKIYHSSFDFQIENKYEAWASNGWKDGYNNKIDNWKNKLARTMVHFKKEYSTQQKPLKII